MRVLLYVCLIYAVLGHPIPLDVMDSADDDRWAMGDAPFNDWEPVIDDDDSTTQFYIWRLTMYKYDIKNQTDICGKEFRIQEVNAKAEISECIPVACMKVPSVEETMAIQIDCTLYT